MCNPVTYTDGFEVSVLKSKSVYDDIAISSIRLLCSSSWDTNKNLKEYKVDSVAQVLDNKNSYENKRQSNLNATKKVIGARAKFEEKQVDRNDCIGMTGLEYKVALFV